MRIRTAALTDLAALTAIERACFPLPKPRQKPNSPPVCPSTRNTSG